MRRFLFLSVTLGLIALIGGCSPIASTSVSESPVINSISQTYSEISPGGTVYFYVSATDSDDDSLSYTWSSSTGNFAATNNMRTNWSAPATTGNYIIYITISDGSNTIQGSTSINVTDTPAQSDPLYPSDIEAPEQVTELIVHDQSGSEGTISLIWTNYQAPSDIDHYNVYMSESYFASVRTMEPVSSSVEQFCYMSGLTDGQSYYIAVTAVDLSGNIYTPVVPTVGVPIDDIAPAPPAGVTVVTGNQYVTLTWIASAADDLAGYRIYRNTSSSISRVSSQLINSSLLTALEYSDNTVVNGTTYYYAITAVDDGAPTANESVLSDVVLARPSGNIPSAPDNLYVLVNGSQQIVTWDAVTTHEDGTSAVISYYVIYRSDSETDELINIGESSDSSFTDYLSSSELGTQYYYRVTAVNDQGRESQYSGVVTHLNDGAPGVPAGLTAEGNMPNDLDAHLFWDANSEADLAGYKVYQASQSSGPYSLVDTTYAEDGITIELGASGTFFYRISAYDYHNNESGMCRYVFMNNIQPPSPNLARVESISTASVTMAWGMTTMPSDLAGFRVYRSTSSFVTTNVTGVETGVSTSTQAQLAGAELIADEDDLDDGTMSYEDTDVESEVTYYYRVLAIDRFQNQSYLSIQRSVTAL